MYFIETAKCTKDDECVKVCPVDAIKRDVDDNLVVTEECIDCDACVGGCDAGAIHPV